ncbi:S41 family peptidase [Megalodesulfovibrio gigas]|uniref:Putative carboxyl-terminal protease n=1 Tax=Megalodesulfovibrio gigas (strain ATCC 19364 / DSM 1382 / NCIMB 9332 / VKM B-1759) TaxID=1121448 RepID=T2GEU9_MEGG1|nr:S41 family peptidase [Megalodesulfovibrio gigas]AGW14457.1 putative carboxyl-terminal protease [Megalodesulfovibrio gigas DSM 1382 = ATCC 19364]
MHPRLICCTLLLALCVAVPPAHGQGKAENRYDPLKRFSQVLDMVETYYVRDVNRQELVEGAVGGMLEKLDPHSAYMDKEAFSEMQVSTSGEFSGIGIEIGSKDSRLIVISPIEDTPAFRAGLRTGDLILEIDGQSTQGMSLVDAVKLIRGPKGSEVLLTILHKNSRTPEKVSILRDTIPIISVKSEVLEDGILYLRLNKFNEHSTEEMENALAAYHKKGRPLKGVVLDLRNNPGGLLDQAVSITDLFLSEGMIVYIQGRDKRNRKDFTATRSSDDITVPMVTLINAGSASASEIVAGALQDHKRSLLIGEPTFGKGSVQTIIPLSDGAGMKLTTALYYTPGGRTIQAEGIKPDMHVPLATDDLNSLADMREKDLTRHLENGRKDKVDPASQASKVQEMLEKDNQLRLALQFVKNPPAGFGPK